MRSRSAFIVAGAALGLLLSAPPPCAAGPEAADAGAAPAQATPPAAAPGAVAAIVMHEGVPGVLYLGQTLVDFMARFPAAKSSPFAGQSDVVRLQVPEEGISALAMGLTPPAMTIESIGFNFAGTYEGVEAGTRRTREGIGAGSTVNELLETYGRPVETAPESRRGALSPRAAPDRDAPARYLYRNADATIATYFVIEGSRVVRMAMSHPAAVERWILKRENPAPAPSVPPPHRPPSPPDGGS
jgi:hypothetical protein